MEILNMSLINKLRLDFSNDFDFYLTKIKNIKFNQFFSKML